MATDIPRTLLAVRVKQVLAAMYAVREAYQESTTGNIAKMLGHTTERTGTYLQKMARKGLVRKTGMYLDWTGCSRVKHMLWRVNAAQVREWEEDQQKEQEKNVDGKASKPKKATNKRVKKNGRSDKTLVRQARKVLDVLRSEAASGL
jgi:hypothetical protein